MHFSVTVDKFFEILQGDMVIILDVECWSRNPTGKQKNVLNEL